MKQQNKMVTQLPLQYVELSPSSVVTPSLIEEVDRDIHAMSPTGSLSSSTSTLFFVPL